MIVSNEYYVENAESHDFIEAMIELEESFADAYVERVAIDCVYIECHEADLAKVEDILAPYM